MDGRTVVEPGREEKSGRRRREGSERFIQWRKADGFSIATGREKEKRLRYFEHWIFFLPHAATEMEAIGGDQRSGVKRTGRTRLK